MNQVMAVWGFAGFTLLTSFWLARMVIEASQWLNIGTDELAGVQKLHTHRVARLGGVPVFISLLFGLLFLSWTMEAYKTENAFLIVCLLPVFGIGLIEDVTRRVGVIPRLIVAMISGAMGWWLFHAGLFRIGSGVFDAYLATHAAAGLMMTVMAAAGSAQAVNIIDGCNGLSGFFIMAALATLAYVAAENGDGFVMQASLLALAATGGFFVWNFPNGRIFLGDAGAYMMGFLIAQLSMILVTRNPAVSPWCAMLIMAYPAWETLFSMYRRARHGLRQMGRPDARHLHQMVYRRILKWAPAAAGHEVRDFRSAFTSVLLWPLMLLCMVPAAVYWHEPMVLFSLCWLFVATYLVMFLAIVRFRVPRTLTQFVRASKVAVEASNKSQTKIPRMG